MIRLSTGRVALFGTMLVFALIALLPLRLALDWIGVGDDGVAAQRVEGSVWAGRLVDAHVGEVALGDVRARVSPLPLAVGQARLELASVGNAVATTMAPASVGRGVHGALIATRHTLGVDDMTATLATGRLFAPLPVTALDLDDATVRFVDGRCDRAEGRVRATLSGEVGGVALPPSLSGPARCEAGALLLTLASEAGTETATLRIGGDSRYRAEFVLRQPDPQAITRLQLGGFVATPDGYRLTVEGRY